MAEQIVTSSSMDSQMPIHPHADLLPQQSEEEFQSLCDDIAEDGLLNPIAVYQGQILDGRHRHRACLELGISPRYDYLADDIDPLRYVLAQNIVRRHLSPSQLGILAAMTVNSGLGSNQYRGREGVPAGTAITREKAAKAWGVGVRTVARGQAILRHDDEGLIERVRNGDLTLSAAERVVRRLVDGKPLLLHPLCGLFPHMPEHRFEGLKKSIERLGVLLPITLYDGYLLDGKCRARACQELGLDVPYQYLPANTDPFEYVLSVNVRRRHLTEDQIQLVAGGLVEHEMSEQDRLALDYHLAFNLHRRHLSQSQLSVIAASLVDVPESW